MKLVNPNVEYIPQGDGMLKLWEHIEKCGRTCYKSEFKGNDNAFKFVNMLIERGHTSMLEHGTVYLIRGVEQASPNNMVERYMNNPYSKVAFDEMGTRYITTNYRVIVDNLWEDDLKFSSFPTKYHSRRYTFRIITDRATSMEILRHRIFSFAQESTRYCNYSLNKFNNEITCVLPLWIEAKEGSYTLKAIHRDEDLLSPYSLDKQASCLFVEGLCKAEDYYFSLLERKWSAEQARQILPNALKTELCVTGFKEDWKHFLDLRLHDKTGKAHPEIKRIAEMIKNLLP